MGTNTADEPKRRERASFFELTEKGEDFIESTCHSTGTPFYIFFIYLFLNSFRTHSQPAELGSNSFVLLLQNPDPFHMYASLFRGKYERWSSVVQW